MVPIAGLVLGIAPMGAPVVALGHPLDAVVSDNPVNHTPHVLDGAVRAIATVGSRVYVGGTFSSVSDASRTTTYARSRIFAFDRTTGEVLDFAPAVDGVVETIAPAPDGTSIIIGGQFRTVNGTAQRSLAMLGPDGTRNASFTARTNGVVNKVLVRGTRLVAGGRFGRANGVARPHLAGFDATTGALDALNLPLTEGRVKANGTVTKPAIEEMDADASGSQLVIVGNFRRVAGQLRQQIALIDLIGGSVSPWSTRRFPNGPSGSGDAWQCYQAFDTQMRDVEFAPDGSYFVAVTTGGAPDRNVGSLCDTASRWETTSTPDATPTWRNCTGGDTLYSVAVTNAAVYLGGHQRWLDNCGGRDSAVTGSFAADGIGAVDPATGLAIRTWNPGRTRGVGVQELVAQDDGLYLGSDTDRLAGEFHARVGLFPPG